MGAETGAAQLGSNGGCPGRRRGARSVSQGGSHSQPVPSGSQQEEAGWTAPGVGGAPSYAGTHLDSSVRPTSTLGLRKD